MPMRASKWKARHKSTQDQDNSPSTSSQRPGTEKSSSTNEQITEIPQQVECKIARKVKDEFRKTEKTILIALGSLSENPFSGNNMSVETTVRGEESGQDCLESYGLYSDQENVSLEVCLPILKQNFMTSIYATFATMSWQPFT